MTFTLAAILLRLTEHGPQEARKLFSSQWGFLAPEEYALALSAIASA